MLEDGARKAFGPRDEVLKEKVRNVAQITDALSKTTKGKAS